MKGCLGSFDRRHDCPDLILPTGCNGSESALRLADVDGLNQPEAVLVNLPKALPIRGLLPFLAPPRRPTFAPRLIASTDHSTLGSGQNHSKFGSSARPAAPGCATSSCTAGASMPFGTRRGPKASAPASSTRAAVGRWLVRVRRRAGCGTGRRIWGAIQSPVGAFS